MAIKMKALGITPQYVVMMRSASPSLRNADADDIVELKAVGATPDYVRELARAGLPNLDPETIKDMKAVGLTPDYMRSIRALGVEPTVKEFVELREEADRLLARAARAYRVAAIDQPAFSSAAM